MKRFVPYIKGLLLVAFIIFLYGFSGKRNEAEKIRKVEISFVNGNNLFITYDMVNKLLIQNHGALTSQPKENIILSKLEHTMYSNKMVEKAEVFLSVDGELGVLITQKTPIARLNQKEQAFYMDTNGNKMPLSSNYSARVPVVEGGGMTRELFRLAKFIYDDPFLKKQVVGIIQHPDKTFVLKTRVGKQSIELGTVDGLNEKVRKLKAFYQKTMNDETLYNYKNINLVYKDQVVCTKI